MLLVVIIFTGVFIFLVDRVLKDKLDAMVAKELLKRPKCPPHSWQDIEQFKGSLRCTQCDATINRNNQGRDFFY